MLSCVLCGYQCCGQPFILIPQSTSSLPQEPALSTVILFTRYFQENTFFFFEINAVFKSPTIYFVENKVCISILGTVFHHPIRYKAHYKNRFTYHQACIPGLLVAIRTRFSQRTHMIRVTVCYMYCIQWTCSEEVTSVHLSSCFISELRLNLFSYFSNEL
jgi:hypothetical protein